MLYINPSILDDVIDSYRAYRQNGAGPQAAHEKATECATLRLGTRDQAWDYASTAQDQVEDAIKHKIIKIGRSR